MTRRGARERLAMSTKVVMPRKDIPVWESMLRECEKHAHNAGWDARTWIFLIDHIPDGPNGFEALGVVLAPIPPELEDVVPHQLLQGLAEAWVGPASYVAAAIVFEAHLAPVDLGDQRQVAAADRARQSRQLKDHPGSRVARVAMLTTARPNMGVAQLIRFQGEEPGSVHAARPGTGDLDLVAMSLRLLALAMSPEAAESRAAQQQARHGEASQDG